MPTLAGPVRSSSIGSPQSILAVIAAAVSMLSALPQTGPVVAAADDRGWALTAGSASEPPPQSFEVIHRAEGFVRARITVAPKFALSRPGSIQVTLGDRVTKNILEQRDPSGSLIAGVNKVAWLGVVAEIAYPYQRITKVRLVFDKGTVESVSGGAVTYDLAVPTGATRLVSLVVSFAWQQNQKTLIFEGAALPGGAAVQIVSADAPFGRLEVVRFGELFRVEVIYLAPRSDPQVGVSVATSGGATLEVLARRSGDDAKRYLSEPILLGLPPDDPPIGPDDKGRR